MGTTLNNLPLELLQRIAAFASTDAKPIALRDLTAAKSNIFESFRLSRLLTSAFLKDFAWNNYIELTSVDILHKRRSVSIEGHHRFGRDKTLLPFHSTKIRNLQVLVYVGCQRDYRKHLDDFEALAYMIEFFAVIRETFPNLRNLVVKLEWVAPFGPEFDHSLLELYDAAGDEVMYSFMKVFERFFPILHEADVEHKTLVCEQTGSETDFSDPDEKKVVLQLSSQTVVPGCAAMDTHLREGMKKWVGK